MNKIRANQIVSLALKARKTYLNAKANSPVCPFNLAESMGMDVRFIKISSFEGMYLADSDVILISSQRPEGRKRFTCAHELGHHILNHGTVIDEMLASGSDKEIEKEADFFASMLLMPSSLIRVLGKRLDFDFSNPSPEKIYIMSKYIGVSFEALLTQLVYNLGLIKSYNYQQLKKIKVSDIKRNLYSEYEKTKDVFVVGDWWQEKAVDAVEGDSILVGTQCEVEGGSISLLDDGTIKCISPGISKIYTADWACFVRVSRAGYSGMYQYMHIEDEE